MTLFFPNLFFLSLFPPSHVFSPIHWTNITNMKKWKCTFPVQSNQTWQYMDVCLFHIRDRKDRENRFFFLQTSSLNELNFEIWSRLIYCNKSYLHYISNSLSLGVFHFVFPGFAILTTLFYTIVWRPDNKGRWRWRWRWKWRWLWCKIK